MLLTMVTRQTNKLPQKTKVEEKYNSLKQAIAGLTPDLAPLQTAKTQLQMILNSQRVRLV